jgi:hypothetical protein
MTTIPLAVLPARIRWNIVASEFWLYQPADFDVTLRRYAVDQWLAACELALAQVYGNPRGGRENVAPHQEV